MDYYTHTANSTNIILVIDEEEQRAMTFILDPFRMITDIGHTSPVIFVWGGLLNIPQAVGGLVFIQHLEAQMILALAIVTLLMAGRIHRNSPFSRLIGLCHLPWLFLVPWMSYRMVTIEHPFGLDIWLYYTIATIVVSLVFDAMDIYRYSKGQQIFAWSVEEKQDVG
jgi:hypothetical protein